MSTRTLASVIASIPTSDGAGVKLRRSLGARSTLRVDPFLMLDEFGTDNPDDYIGGFPPHPHRGFETVTYMLDGHMRHEDHMGNVGDLTPGGVQWMTAGRGIIHSELPQQADGRMRGFQLWINLPSAEKMKPATYRDIPADDIPLAKITGGTVKVIAGTFHGNDTITGPISGLTTEPLFFDVCLDKDTVFEHGLTATHSAFVYAYEGQVEVGPEDSALTLPRQAAGVLTPGDAVRLKALADTRVIVLAGKPINEPVEQQGPFVMNTRKEIEQAISDYRDGTLATVARKE
ncbi:MAG: pirin family protein [Gammaproteobacteria bacterium]|nr:pirin family protein [Gammaproteobacteria bacterium]